MPLRWAKQAEIAGQLCPNERNSRMIRQSTVVVLGTKEATLNKTSNLQGKVALVTGASRWLGASIAERLATSGATVAANYFSQQKAAQKVVDRITQHGGTGQAFRADVTDQDQVSDMIQRISEVYGPIDIVVNCAAGPRPYMTIEDQEWQDFLDQLIYSVKAPMLILKAVLPWMKARKYGRIVNIGSDVVETGCAEFGHYVAAKGALLALTRSWANELSQHKITVNLVAPGWIPREADQDTEAYAAYVDSVPLGRAGTPWDVAATVVFLASEGAGFITGQKLAVNGGTTHL
jgi:3-oxoacyl-[acyl-carrier protein] reductase